MSNEHLETEAARDSQVPEADETRLAEHVQAPPNDLRDRLQALVPQEQENSRSRSTSPFAPAVNAATSSQAANEVEAPNRPLSPAVGWDWREIDDAALDTPPDEPENSQADSSTITTAAAGVEHTSHHNASNPRAATVEEADDNDNL